MTIWDKVYWYDTLITIFGWYGDKEDAKDLWLDYDLCFITSFGLYVGLRSIVLDILEE
jgi:hypothetical protein